MHGIRGTGLWWLLKLYITGKWIPAQLNVLAVTGFIPLSPGSPFKYLNQLNFLPTPKTIKTHRDLFQWILQPLLVELEAKEVCILLQGLYKAITLANTNHVHNTKILLHSFSFYARSLVKFFNHYFSSVHYRGWMSKSAGFPRGRYGVRIPTESNQ